MRRTGVLLALAAGMAAAAYSQTAPKPAEFEVRVGGKSYDAAPDVPFRVTTPGGEAVEVIVRHKETLRFTGHGIAFSYPRQMRVSAEKLDGVAMVTVECAESPMVMIQLFDPGVTPAELQTMLMDQFRTEFTSRKGRVVKSKGPAAREIGGVKRTGGSLEIDLAGQKLTVEVYAFSKGGSAMAVTLQHDSGDAVLAKRYFPVILDSLR